MAERDIKAGRASNPAGESLKDLNWVVAKSLLDANARTSQAFEHHLLRTYRSENSSNAAEIRTHIEQAIEEHERIVENLELALEAVDQFEADSTSPSVSE